MLAAAFAGDNVARLDVPVNQTPGMRLLQGTADLAEKVNGTLGRQRAMPLDQVFQVQARKVLHRIVERAILRVAVVEHLDSIRVRQRGRRLDLALKAEEAVRVHGPVRPDQLDGTWPAEENVLGEIHLAHTARAEALPHLVLSHLPPGEYPA